MIKKKNKLPDFNTMTREEEAEWFDIHDLGDYWSEFKDFDLTVELKKPKDEALILRLQKGVKNKLNKVAQSKGLNVSTLARMWIIEKLRSA